MTADAGAMVISGKGTVRYNLADGVNEHSGTITVQSPATFELGAGVKSGTGAVTVNGDATLSLPESGTATIGGNLTLQSGAKLKFNFTDTSVAPVLELASGKTLALGGTVNVTVSAEKGLNLRNAEGLVRIATGIGSPDATKFVLAGNVPSWVDGAAGESAFTVDGGDLYLRVKMPGLMILVR